MNPTEIKIITKEFELLKRIGSEKDPLMFHSMRSMLGAADRTKNRSIIVNFSEEGNQHGCRFTCKFCSWKKPAIAMGFISPSNEAIESFLSDFEGYKVTLSGGGDPLFNIRKNYNELMRIVDKIHSLGFLVEVVTKEIGLVSLEHKKLLKKIDCWSFSSEGTNEMVRLTARAVEMARISKVIVPGHRSNKNLAEYVKYYTEVDSPYQILLREDYNGEPTKEDIPHIGNALRSSDRVRFLRNETCANNFFLINEKVHSGQSEFMGIQL